VKEIRPGAVIPKTPPADFTARDPPLKLNMSIIGKQNRGCQKVRDRDKLFGIGVVDIKTRRVSSFELDGVESLKTTRKR